MNNTIIAAAVVMMALSYSAFGCDRQNQAMTSTTTTTVATATPAPTK